MIVCCRKLILVDSAAPMLVNWQLDVVLNKLFWRHAGAASNILLVLFLCRGGRICCTVSLRCLYGGVIQVAQGVYLIPWCTLLSVRPGKVVLSHTDVAELRYMK